MDGEPGPQPGRGRPARRRPHPPAHAADGRALTLPELAWAGGEGRASALLVTGATAADGADGAGSGLAVVPAGALAVPSAVVPMAGRWDRDGDALRFTPGLPFARGTTYVLVRPAAPGWVELARLQRPGAGTAPSAAVLAVHPDVDEVPENLLRLSLTSSAPVEEGSAAGRVRLEDPAGHEVPQALLPMPPELWDRQGRRLTVLLEPGRTKRGLVPHTALGAPLAGLAAFDVVVDAGVRDATGAPLAAGTRRTYRVGPPVRSRVDPARWRTSWPAPGSQDDLAVVFDRPLDHVLALRCLVIVDGDGAAVPGSAALGRGGVRWTFSPRSPWPRAGVRIRVDAALEDLAGNSVRRVFDRDLRLDGDDPLTADEVVLAPGPAA